MFLAPSFSLLAYSSLETNLKIEAEGLATPNSDISRPFDKPKSRWIAVKVIKHLEDEVI
jgi:adenine-specific DNA-methyltransferase